MYRQNVKRHTYSQATTPASLVYDGFLDRCGNRDLLSLSFQGQNPFLDWIGWDTTTNRRVSRAFLEWTRPAYEGDSPTPGWVADPCSAPGGIDYGFSELDYDGFARLRRGSPVRDVTEIGINYCETQPLYRIDGSQILNQKEFDMARAMEVVFQDVSRLSITGNKDTAGQFDGLENIVATDYDSTMMNSVVFDWAGNDMGGGPGITYNGIAVPETTTLVEALLWANRITNQRISWSPALRNQRFVEGNKIILAPSNAIRCLLDWYICWSVCGGDISRIDSLEARQARDDLLGGLYGDGRVFLDALPVPIIAYDYGLIKSNNRFDMYLLTGSVGMIRMFEGQMSDMSGAAQNSTKFSAFDGNKILNWSESYMTCEPQFVEMRPRILCWGPWAQTRFQNVTCDQVGLPISPDPTTSWFPKSSFISAGA